MQSRAIGDHTQSPAKRLTKIFASIVFAGAWQAKTSFAQDAETVPDSSGTAGAAAASFNDEAQETLPDYLRFKPLALCREAEENTPDDIKAIALDDDAFSSTQDWAGTDQAAQIMTYRLCREENPAAMGDDVVLDVLRREKDRPWMPAVIRPFVQEDPGLYFKIRNFMIQINGITYTPDDLQSFRRRDDNPLVRHSAAQLLTVAADPDRAERIINGESYYRYLAEHDEIMRTAFATDPLLMLDNMERYERVGGILPQPGDIVPILMEAAKDPERAKLLIRKYEFYMALPDAATIVKTAINTVPTYFIYRLAGRGMGPLHDDLKDNAAFFPDAQILLDVSLVKDDKTGHIRKLIRHYETYIHLPEAGEIFGNAINTSPSEYFRLLSDSEALRTFLGDNPPMPSIETMMAAASDRKTAPSMIYPYAYYRHLPGAEDVIKIAARTAPGSFLEHASGRLWRSLPTAEIRRFLPPADILLRAATEEKNSYIFIKRYDVYAHLPEAKDIVRTAIAKGPGMFLSFLSDGHLDRALAGDASIFPSAGMLMKAAESYHGAIRLFRYYDLYAHLPEAKDIVRRAAEHHPFVFLRYRNNRDSPDSLKNDDSLWPDSNIFISKMNDETSAMDAISNYETYAHMPWARAVLAKAVETSPSYALQIIERNFYRKQIGHNGFDNDANLAILLQIMEQDPNKLSEHIGRTLENVYIFVTLARHEPALMDFVLKALEEHENRTGALHFLSHPENPRRIAQLSTAVQDRLLAVARPHLSGECTATYSYVKMMHKDSWLIGSGRLTQSEIAFAIGCAIEGDLFSAVRLIEDNDKLILDPPLLRAAVLNHATSFLERVTAKEKAEDFVLNNIRVPYDDILQAAQQDLGAETLNYAMRRRAVSIVNHLHNYDDQTRFAVLRDMTPQNRVKLAGEDDDAYYTSSFNRIMADALDVLSHDESVRTWLFSDGSENESRYRYDRASEILSKIAKNAMHFGKMDAFLSILTPDEVGIIATRIMDRLTNISGDYERSNASVLTATILPILEYMKAGGYGAQVERSIIAQYEKAGNKTQRNAVGILASLYASRQDVSEDSRAFFEAAHNGYAKALQNYMRETLSTDDLFDDKGRNFQMMVFYDDRDGHATFGHFKAIYKTDRRWQYADHGSYISFSRGGVTLYANKPWHKKSGNSAIIERVKDMGGKVSVLVHRGHSYHVDRTADDYLNTDVKFLWLGSCRSSSIWRYIDEAPDMQFIYSQNVGTMLINDPLLKNINDTLAGGSNIHWPQMRDDAYKLSHGDMRVKDYIFPDGSIEYGIRMTIALFNESNTLNSEAKMAMDQALSEGAQTPGEVSVTGRQLSISYN